MEPQQPFSLRARLISRLRFVGVILVVAVTGIVLLINVHAISPNGTVVKGSVPAQPAAVAGPTPSGIAMPTGDTTGWRMAFSDDFNGSQLNPNKWNAYEGPAGGDPDTLWDPSHVVVKGGMLQLQNYRDPNDNNKWVSGGVSSDVGLHQTFGKYLVRFRMDAGNGITGILLLWPENNQWPPEIDFAENGGGDRSSMTSNLYYGSNNQAIQHSVQADFTQWHTIGVEWTPGSLKYTLDGQVWATVQSPYVPTVPMSLDLQTQAGSCSSSTNPCPDNTTPKQVTMDVDWVVAYAPA
jgi:beta-glucanase (GH16 family)